MIIIIGITSAIINVYPNPIGKSTATTTTAASKLVSLPTTGGGGHSRTDDGGGELAHQPPNKRPSLSSSPTGSSRKIKYQKYNNDNLDDTDHLAKKTVVSSKSKIVSHPKRTKIIVVLQENDFQ